MRVTSPMFVERNVSHSFMNKNISKKQFLQAINEEINHTDRCVIDYMLLFSLKNNFNFICQRRIALYLKLSIRTVSRSIKKLYELGIIIYKKQRGFNKSNLYKFNQLIFELKEYFFTIFPSLKWCKKALHKATKEKSGVLCIQGRLYLYNPPITMLVRVKKNIQSLVGTITGRLKNKFFGRIEEKEEKISIKGKNMVMNHSRPILSPLIKRISKALNLTEYGELKLLVLPEEALQATFDEYNRRNGYFTNPFFWFLTYGKGYCLQRDIKVDWEMWQTLKRVYNVPDNPIWVHEKKATLPPKNKYIPPEISIDTQKEAALVEEARTTGKLGKGFEFPYPGSNN